MSDEPLTHAPALQYTVEAKLVRRGLAHASCREASIEFDTSVGQSDSHMGPADLLAAAFAACVLKNIERFARMLPFTYQTASIRVTLERRDKPPRITSVQYEVRIVSTGIAASCRPAPPQSYAVRYDLQHAGRRLPRHGIDHGRAT